MMVQQPGYLQWQTNYVSNVQNSNTIRSLQEELGEYCHKVSTVGQWSLQESKLHINVLELLIIKISLLTFSKLFNFKSIHFQVGNMGALS